MCRQMTLTAASGSGLQGGFGADRGRTTRQSGSVIPKRRHANGDNFGALSSPEEMPCMRGKSLIHMRKMQIFRGVFHAGEIPGVAWG